jgi:NAD(P)-dependent dehydrogenase (short-subunit alcohol dehydrogenase family)
MGRLAGKVAIVTGASGGAGAVMAARFAAEGARVVLAARRLELVEQAAAAIGGNAIAVAADVTREEDVAAMVARAVHAFGQVDVLVNNAAAPGQDRFIWEQTLDNWNATFAIDLTAAMLCTREVLNASMLARRTGAIVNLSSTAGMTGIPRKSHYATAKAALRTLTKSVALEVGEYGIRCNCIVPGRIDTALYRAWIARRAAEEGRDAEELGATELARLPLRTLSTADDIANLALFLASDESRTITGQSINCDSGAVMAG